PARDVHAGGAGRAAWRNSAADGPPSAAPPHVRQVGTDLVPEPGECIDTAWSRAKSSRGARSTKHRQPSICRRQPDDDPPTTPGPRDTTDRAWREPLGTPRPPGPRGRLKTRRHRAVAVATFRP